MPNYLIFILFALLAIAIGQIVPSLLKLIFYLFDRKKEKNLYELFIQPIRGAIKFCSTLTLIYWANGLWPREYEAASEFLEPLIDLVFLLAIAWIISRILTQFIRAYG
ncbi:MAG: mechanosensitive ion channel family protein, partial [Xenococcaceae cyanobacterium MO_167.B52]|nr:mechanosensitive ion channel family protein [Xenococcaceae cyanobacterium MO_167.B52]